MSKNVTRESIVEQGKNMGFGFSEHADRIIDLIERNGGYCPCVTNDNVPCPCPQHQDSVEKNGKCHCGLFVKHTK